VYRATQKVTLHDKIIEVVASAHAATFEVRTNPSSEKNWYINSNSAKHFPDIILLPKGSNQSTIIIEVETGESVSEEHALEQWVPYANLGRKFYLLVPTGSLNDAKTICRRNRIPAHFGQYWWDGTHWTFSFEE
jgi:hypothetical protein